MTTTQSNSKKQKHKHTKRKERIKHYLDLGTPQVPLRNRPPKQTHELLSDWKDAT